MKKIVIGISSSTAKAGKDTFYLILKKLIEPTIPVHRLSIADHIRSELKPHLKKLYGIDPSNCSPEEKEVVRQFMVQHGIIRRTNSQGRYFLEKLSKDFARIKEGIVCVTDVRFKEFEWDETDWTKENGVLVYLKPYVLVNHENRIDTFGEPEYLVSRIEEEKIMAPRLESAADFVIEWEHKNLSQKAAVEDKENQAHVLDFIERSRLTSILREF